MYCIDSFLFSQPVKFLRLQEICIPTTLLPNGKSRYDDSTIWNLLQTGGSFGTQL